MDKINQTQKIITLKVFKITINIQYNDNWL
jgi:hypothetical protein